VVYHVQVQGFHLEVLRSDAQGLGRTHMTGSGRDAEQQQTKWFHGYVLGFRKRVMRAIA
jgi:hypothetical protein